MVKLGINIDHVATIRQARGTRYPDPVYAAMEAERAGADAITLHLREDRRHIQEHDIEHLMQVLQTRMNLEMAVTEEMISFAETIKPHDCCLVPERRQELTTEGGLDVASQMEKVSGACRRLKNAGINVSLFIDADPTQLMAAKEVGAPIVELHTGHFANAAGDSQRKAEFVRIEQTVEQGIDLGLQVNAGHGLTYHNVADIAVLPGISELNIGHVIVAEAVFSGFYQAVQKMKQIINEASS